MIETGKQYGDIGNCFGALVGKGRARTPGETKLMRLLALLIGDYDRRNALPPDHAAPGERLRFLIQHSGKTPADLLPVFGQRSHVNETLNGKRRISAKARPDLQRQAGSLHRMKNHGHILVPQASL